MNREQRRAAERDGMRWLIASERCEECGAPICPECGVEATECECCGEFNCERCRAYLLAPVREAD